MLPMDRQLFQMDFHCVYFCLIQVAVVADFYIPWDAILSLVLVARYSFGVAETVGILVAGKGVYRTSAVRNAIPVDADISVFDDSYMDLAKVEDYAEVRLAVADYNLVVEYALRQAEKAVMVVDCQMKGRANAVRRPLECPHGLRSIDVFHCHNAY